jgi:hypothetical protein
MSSRYSRATAIWPGCPRATWMRASKGASLPLSASTDIAPATTAAPNTSSAPNNPAKASAVETCVPLIKARPSFARSFSGCRPARQAFGRGQHRAAHAYLADAEQHRAQMGQGRQIAGGTHRALRRDQGIHLMLEQREQGVDDPMVMPECPRASALILSARMRRTTASGSGSPTPGRVREQKIALQQLELFGGYARLRQQAEARVDAVGGLAHGDDLLHQRARGGNAAAVVRRQAQGNRPLVDAPQRRQASTRRRESPGHVDISRSSASRAPVRGRRRWRFRSRHRRDASLRCPDRSRARGESVCPRPRCRRRR